MKKVLFLSLILAIGMMGFAQVPVKKGDISKIPTLTKVKSRIDAQPVNTPNNFNHEVMTKVAAHRDGNDTIEDWETMMTNYDLQSNSALGNRIAMWPDGSVAVAMTWDNTGTTSYALRGTGYNYYDGAEFGEMPEDRVESIYSGWPSIAALGDGEILASHGGGNVNIFKRETKGEGSWENIKTFEACTWPRIATTGNGQYVHVVSCEQDASNTLLNYVYYMRSEDGGETFTEMAYPPMVDVEGMYKNNISADDYVIATNGNTIAILFGSMNYDLFYIISHDNGQTWEKQIVVQFPYDHALDWNQTTISSETDSIWAPDNSHTIAIDNNGVVHVAFALSRWAPAPESGAGYYSYWPYTQAIVYWNSEFVNEQGGHEIPLFGNWSGDEQLLAEFPWMINNGTNGVSNSLNDERLYRMAEADGNKHLHLFGWPDENGDGVYDVSELWSNSNDNDAVKYRTHGIATMPSICIDENGALAIMYSVLSETRIYTGQVCTAGWYWRSGYFTFRDNTGTWFDDIYSQQNYDFSQSEGEVYYTTAAPHGVNGSFWFVCQEDDTPGLLVDGDGSIMRDNFQHAIKISPSSEMVGFSSWGVEENVAVNPMTAVEVYPNPVVDVLNIKVNASQNSAMNISVYNIMGQKVMESNANIYAGDNNRLSVNTSDLTSGIYFVTVKANGFEQTQKFIVK